MTSTPKTANQRSEDRDFNRMRNRERIAQRTKRKMVVVYFAKAMIFAAHSTGGDPMGIDITY